MPQDRKEYMQESGLERMLAKMLDSIAIEMPDRFAPWAIEFLRREYAGSAASVEPIEGLPPWEAREDIERSHASLNDYLKDVRVNAILEACVVEIMETKPDNVVAALINLLAKAPVPPPLSPPSPRKRAPPPPLNDRPLATVSKSAEILNLETKTGSAPLA